MRHHPTHVKLFKRGPVWYLDYWLDGKRIKESTGFDRKSDAELIQEDLQRKLVNNRTEHLKHREVPVHQAYREYLRHDRARFKASSTIDNDRYLLKNFFRWAALRTIDLFTTKKVMDFFAFKVKVDKIGVTSVRRLREGLHAFFNFVLRSGYIEKNPVSDFKAPRLPERDIRFLSAGQIEGCLKAVEGNRLEPLIGCAIFAGLRREEFCWLTWDDVDLSEEKPLLKIRAKDIDGEHWHPKNKKNRNVPVSRRLHPYLVNLRIQRGDKPWVFLSPKGCRWDPDNLGHRVKKLLKGVGLKWILLDLRHTFGSHLAKKGISLLKISKLMGNSVRVCERHYAGLLPDDLHEDVEFGHEAEQKSKQPRRREGGNRGAGSP